MLAHCQFILGPGSARARSRTRGILRRQARHRLRQRHRRAAAGAAGVGDRPGRRRDLPVIHFPRDGGTGRAARRDAGFRRRRGGHFQYRSGKSGTRGRDRKGARAETAAIIPVDLFGLPADHDAIAAIAASGRPVDARRRRAGVSARPIAAASSARSATATATSFFRPSRSAVMATAARYSPTMMRWPRA